MSVVRVGKRARSVDLVQSKRVKRSKSPTPYGPIRDVVARKGDSEGRVCRVFVHGACSGNPHRRTKERLGGYGIYFESNGATLSGTLRDEVKARDSNDSMTNDRLELLAVIMLLERAIAQHALDFCEDGPSFSPVLPGELSCDSTELRVVGDNEYVLNTATDWLRAWRKNNFCTKKGKPVKNMDLVRRLYSLIARFEREEWPLSFQCVRAHQPEPDKKYWFRWSLWHGNARADAAAKQSAAAFESWSTSKKTV